MSELIVANEYGHEMGLSSEFKKAPPPKLGDKFGLWSGRDAAFARLPGGAVLQFDLSKLTLADYRVMKDHYQINASMTLLTHMLHQIDWHIECEDKKIASFVEDNLRLVWTRLVRGLSQAFWAGYSPMVIEYENNINARQVEINKLKDLVPEDCEVNWEEFKGWAPRNQLPPKLFRYDGIKQRGVQFPIPSDNTLWYSLLMENGDMYGRKLLKAAFPSWFFSTLIHLFANRYFERFGEPLPIGRADYDDQVIVNNPRTGAEETASGRRAMELVLEQIRNRSVVVLPSDRDAETKEYLYDIDYLEGQMRGADFERYMTRLDEEMSISLFTPMLLFRTGESGSYNLGVTQLQTYLWSLNAIASDMKEYIDRFVCERLKAINFSPNAPRCQWVPRGMGRDNAETIRAIITEMVRGDKVKPDLTELGQALGMSLKEIQEVKPAPDPLNQMPGEPVDPRLNTNPPQRPKDRGNQQPGKEPRVGKP